MKKVYSIADNIVSPLGFHSEANWHALLGGQSGVKKHSSASTASKEVYASLIEANALDEAFQQLTTPNGYTRLEKMAILSIQDAAERCDIALDSARTLFVFSTTKGNIDLLENKSSLSSDAKRLRLPAMAKQVTAFFGNPNNPVIVSNACISGVFALMLGSAYIREGLYQYVVVTGGDIISPFTLSGFGSLQALSSGPCKPFDSSRNGINLGEACATMILSATPQSAGDIALKGGSTSNDANHISGPSKTGDGLQQAIHRALAFSEIAPEEIGYVSAHGTATVYNDEMETKALHAADLGEKPVNSVKGYFGHTLGAAGVLETVLASWALQEQTLIASRGYDQHGVSLPLPVIQSNVRVNFNHCIKTASGFGGCNAALVLAKND